MIELTPGTVEVTLRGPHGSLRDALIAVGCEEN